MEFRRATIDDVAAIVAMLADDALGAQREDVSQPLNQVYLTAFERIDRDPNQLLVVADDAGVIAGTMQLTFIAGLSRKGSLRGQIEAVRIASSHRGKGLGREMLVWGIEACRDRGCSTVQLTSDKTRSDAHRFYNGLGFTASHEGYKLML